MNLFGIDGENVVVVMLQFEDFFDRIFGFGIVMVVGKNFIIEILKDELEEQEKKLVVRDKFYILKV